MKESRTTEAELPHYIRAPFLKVICKQLHIIKYCNYFLKLELKQINGSDYQGNCPWCNEKKTLLVNRVTGTSTCLSCGVKGDFFDTITEYWGYDLGFTLKLLAQQFKNAEKFTKAASEQGGAL